MIVASKQGHKNVPVYVMDITGYPISRKIFLVKPPWIVDFFHADFFHVFPIEILLKNHLEIYGELENPPFIPSGYD